jgi:hypothetical protein
MFGPKVLGLYWLQRMVMAIKGKNTFGTFVEESFVLENIEKLVLHALSLSSFEADDQIRLQIAFVTLQYLNSFELNRRGRSNTVTFVENITARFADVSEEVRGAFLECFYELDPLDLLMAEKTSHVHDIQGYDTQFKVKDIDFRDW